MSGVDLVSNLAAMVGLDIDDLPSPMPYDEGLEMRMCAVAESWDEETRTGRRLGPRRDR